MPSDIECYVYIDGQYVRAELRNAKHPDEFDPRKPAIKLREERIHLGVFQSIVHPSRYFYYDALDEDATKEEKERQERFFKRLSNLPNTHVCLGQVRKSAKKKEQKGVDVHLAVDALKAATSRVANVIVLVTGDADFAPLARSIRDTGAFVWIIAFKNSLAESLRREADETFLFDSVPSDWKLDTKDD